MSKAKTESTQDNTWEIKDRTYLLTGHHSPLTYTISSRHSRRFPLLWFDAETGEQKELGALPSLEWGKSLEHEALLHYEMMTGNKVQSFGGENPQFFEYNEHSGGSPDGFANGDILLEVKCPYNGETFIDYMQFRIQADLYAYNKDYYAQLQFNMLCCKKDIAHWIAYDPRIKNPNKRMVILEVEYDEQFCDELLKRLEHAIGYIKNIENDYNNL